MATRLLTLVRSLSLLVRLRWKLTGRAYLRNSSAVIGVGLALLIFGPAALAEGNTAGRELAALPPAARDDFLRPLLNGMQAIWLLLLLPGSAVLLSQSLPAAVLRPFPVKPSVIALAGTLGALLDIPLLLALPILAGVGRGIGVASPWLLALAVPVFLLFALQTAALAQVIEGMGALLSRQRRLSVSFAVVVLLSAWVLVGLPTALRAAPPSLSRSAAARVEKPPAAWTALLPGGLASHALTAAARGAWGWSFLSLLGLAGYTGLTFAGASRLTERAFLRDDSGGTTHEAASRPLSGPVSELAPAAKSPAPATFREQVGMAALTELRNLARNPGAHLPLRQPATLLLACGYGWISPNLGTDYVRNIGDLLGMGSLMYALFWQIQLLTNRLGSEAGTAGLLLGFPVPRHRLLLGKNLTLSGLLLAIDAALLTAFCAAAGRWEWLLPVLLGLPVALLWMTLLGNPLSVLLAFPIPKRTKGFQSEPERSVAFLYALYGGTVGFGVWGQVAAWNVSPLLGIAALGLTIVLYVGSLRLSAWLLTRNEPRLIGILDG